MKKFLVLYRASQAGFEQMMKSTPEQQKAGMAAWMNWSEKAAKSIVDMGAPLGKAVAVKKGGGVSARMICASPGSRGASAWSTKRSIGIRYTMPAKTMLSASESRNRPQTARIKN